MIVDIYVHIILKFNPKILTHSVESVCKISGVAVL